MGQGGKRKRRGEPGDFLLPLFEEVDLPSGMHAKLRPPTLDMHILFGGMPARLHAMAKAAKEGGTVEEQLTPEERLEWAHAVICYCFIEPKFSTGGEPGTFHPSRLRTEDRMFLGKWSGKF